MRVVSITGGVGAGKSEVLKILEKEFGALILIADEIAHQMMEPGEQGYEKVLKALGTSFLGEDGRIDRPALAKIIFRDSEALKTMNSIIHPLVWEYIEKKIEESCHPLVVVEAALFDEEHNRMFDEIWYIYVSAENRVKRLMEGRGYTREKALGIMKNQPDEQAFRSHSDYVIDNNGPFQNTRRQIEELLKRTDKLCD